MTQAAKQIVPDATVVRIQALLPSLPPSSRQVAKYVLAYPAEVAALTITELSHASGVSEASTLRFCRAIGFRGYPDLRITLATELGRAEGRGRSARVVGSDITATDDLAVVVEKITYADARAVEETAAQLDVSSLQAVVDALCAAERIDIYGVGASAFVAADFQQKLHRIGRIAFAWSDTHIALTSAALLGPADVAIGISHTGVTQDTVDAVTEARRQGAVTVALTNFPRSALARVADHVLTTASRETTFRSGAMASRIAQLTVVDCVFVGVAQRAYPQTRAALERTRGAVRSRRLSTRRGGR